MSSTSARATRQPAAARRELFEARHDIVRRIHERLPCLDALVGDLQVRIPRARIEADMVAQLGSADLDVLRAALDDPTFADPDRALLALTEAVRERDALLDLGRHVGAAVDGPPAHPAATGRRAPLATPGRAEPPPPFASQALCASAGTSVHRAKTARE